jgi:hypothetical protein
MSWYQEAIRGAYRLSDLYGRSGNGIEGERRGRYSNPVYSPTGCEAGGECLSCRLPDCTWNEETLGKGEAGKAEVW